LYLIIIAILGGPLVFFPIVAIPLALIVGFLIQIPLKTLTEESQKHAAERQATLIETLGNIESVKTSGGEGLLQQRYEHISNLAAKTGLKIRFYSNMNINYTYFIQQVTYVLVIVYGVYMIHDNLLTTGGLIACAILTSRAIAPMGQIAALLTRYHQAISALRSLEIIMNLPVENPTHKAHLHHQTLLGNIEFRNVDFVYPQQFLPALQNVSFKINQGDRVGIIGRVGSGKSTIAKIILNLYQPSKGTVLIDGKEYNQIDTGILRRQIGYVPQDITLFYGSVRDNITFGIPNVDNQTILRAAELSGLDKFISQHPQGYDLQVGERGYNLSGGQRQTIAITRALLLAPPILLLDEPSNSMDDITENIFKANLLPWLENRTLILVTHKISLLSLVTHLIIMDNGHIVASGPKEIILKALAEGQVKGSTVKTE
jgi:ATP-binding cassette subfamily C protein LapB